MNEQTKGWRLSVSRSGNSQSTHVWVCDNADIDSLRATLLASLDTADGASGGLLGCESVDSAYGTGGSDDPTGGKATLIAHYVPLWKLNQYDVTKAPQKRFNYGSESFTYDPSPLFHGLNAVWDSDKKEVINREVLPLMTLPITEVVLSGARTTLALDTYSGFANTVNYGTFLGAAAGKALFGGASGTPFQKPDGTFIYRYEVSVKFRSIEWNKDYRPKTNTWDTILPDGTNKKFSAVSFASLLTAPG